MDTERVHRRIAAHLLAVEAALVLCTASVRIRSVPRNRLVALLGDPIPPGSEPDHAPTPAQLRSGRRVGRMVGRVAAVLPWHPPCLPQALATQWMLRRRHVPATLHLGVADALSMDAHAWVTVGRRTVVGRLAEPFAPVAAFGGGGAR